MGRTLGADLGVTVANQDIYELSATQKHRLGTRLVRGDCVYKYAKATGAITRNDHLVYTTYHQCLNYVSIVTASPIGSNKLYVTVGAADGIADDGAFAEHALEGGHLVIFINGTQSVLRYQIRDNNAAISAGTMTITIDGELPIATIASTSVVEAIGSPYLIKESNAGGVRGFMGAPVRKMTVALPYGWIQTWGPTWLSPQSRVGAAQYKNALVARNDGSIDIVSGESAMTDDGQRVGYVISYSQAGGQGAPIIMLQISP